ncbi:uncharacterized protein LOC126318231 isoform X2 [Schistocerca gregaria]|nr:uncharacterized protein LOC126318231 isoform X2 [Schistocerca gregaria]
MTTEKALEVEDVEDDLKRETAIYTSTLETVTRALNKLKQEKQKYQRPDDYYAEMVKSDEHMLKLKDHLLAEKRRKEEWYKKLKELQLRKFAKKAQVSVSIKRQKQKAEDLEIVRQWRLKQRNASTKMPFPKELLDVNNPIRKTMLESAPKSNLAPLKSKKRLLKDQHYGYGGSKKFKRFNNQVKEDEDKYLSSVKRRRESKNAFFREKSKNNHQSNSAKKSLKNRPGKQRRQKLK